MIKNSLYIPVIETTKAKTKVKKFTLILYFRESQGKNERRVEAKEVKESLLKIKIYEIYN